MSFIGNVVFYEVPFTGPHIPSIAYAYVHSCWQLLLLSFLSLYAGFLNLHNAQQKLNVYIIPPLISNVLR